MADKIILNNSGIMLWQERGWRTSSHINKLMKDEGRCALWSSEMDKGWYPLSFGGFQSYTMARHWGWSKLK